MLEVETYEQAPIDGRSAPDLEEIQSPEAHDLIERLGLDGQRKLVSIRAVSEDGDTVAATNPYRVMTLEEQRIYQIIAPTHVRLEQYGAGPIPLRVMQVAAHAKPFFKRLEVWSPETATVSDPLLVGWALPPDRTWGEVPYILARWGEALLPLERLRTMATGILEARWTAKLDHAVSQLRSIRETMASQVEYHLRGGPETSTLFSVAVG